MLIWITCQRVNNASNKALITAVFLKIESILLNSNGERSRKKITTPQIRVINPCRLKVLPQIEIVGLIPNKSEIKLTIPKHKTRKMPKSILGKIPLLLCLKNQCATRNTTDKYTAVTKNINFGNS